MDISLVIPFLNEEESIPELISWIERIMKQNGYSYEVIMVDDGSTDHSWLMVEQIHAANPHVKGIKFRRNYGKSAALHTAFAAAQGNVVITMDADLQDSPDEIPELYRMIMEEEYDLVSGWKKQRYDPITKTIPSKFYNYSARLVTGVKLHDMNCGLKAYRNAVVKSIEVYGEMHRYIPVIAKNAGFTRIGEKVVQHRKRKYGSSKFGLERFVNGYLDLMSISFISRFGKRPMHLFGTLGTLMFFIGFFLAAFLGIDKLVHLHRGVLAPLVTTSPYFYIALVTMIIGSQFFLAGFLGELISRNSSQRNEYLVEKTL